MHSTISQKVQASYVILLNSYDCESWEMFTIMEPLGGGGGVHLTLLQATLSNSPRPTYPYLQKERYRLWLQDWKILE